MRKLPTSRSEYFRRIELYRKDLEEIHTILCEVSDEVHIGTETHLLDSVSEIDQLEGLPFRNLEYLVVDKTNRQSRVHVVITDRAVHLSIWDREDATLLRAFEQIKQRLLHRRATRLQAYINSDTGIAFCLASVGLAPFLYLMRSTTGSTKYVLIGILYFILLVMALAAQRIPVVRRRVWINFRNKNEVSTFWTRNRDTIIVGTVMVLLGTLIGKLLP